MIRVLIADDHAVVRAGLVSILGAEPDIRIVGEARDGLEAITKALELKPDIVLMDIFMPHCSGLEAMITIRQQLPDIKVLILTISDREEDLFQSLRLGAQGYLLKSATISRVVEAVRGTAAGEAILSSRIVSKLVAEFREKVNQPQLSKREMEILKLLGEGLTNAEIGNRLFISESTVRTHLYHLLEKLHLRNRAEAVAYAIRHHLNGNP